MSNLVINILYSRMRIKKLPRVLALHLKRFKFMSNLNKYVKLTYRVAFPFELRLFNTVSFKANFNSKIMLLLLLRLKTVQMVTVFMT